MMSRASDLKRYVRAAFLLLASAWASVALAADVVVKESRLWPAPDHTRLVLDLSGKVDHKVFALTGPDRLVIDLSSTRLGVDLSDLKIAGTPITGVRTARKDNKDLRIVLDLKSKVGPRSFLLAPNGEYGDRLVIDLFLDEKNASMAKAPAPNKTVTAVAPKPAKSSSSQAKRDIIVVVDAGHGGDDPGAIGPGGVREKAVVLAISRELQSLISAQRGFNGKMTRTGDYYIGLRQRTQLARKHGADLFISVHADAFSRPEARGASVFTLSERGATSETGRWLEQRENSSDLIGGIGSGLSLDDKDEVLAGVLLDMSMTASLRASVGVGKHVLKSVGQVGTLHKRQVEKAGFMVLKSPDIPSILVETGFISNPVEAQRLNTKKYQKKVARAIFDGLHRYFDETPPPDSLLAWDKGQGNQQTSQYRVQSGDSLSYIADKHEISLSELMRSNGLESYQIREGQVLDIPSG